MCEYASRILHQSPLRCCLFGCWSDVSCCMASNYDFIWKIFEPGCIFCPKAALHPHAFAVFLFLPATAHMNISVQNFCISFFYVSVLFGWRNHVSCCLVRNHDFGWEKFRAKPCVCIWNMNFFFFEQSFFAQQVSFSIVETGFVLVICMKFLHKLHC